MREILGKPVGTGLRVAIVVARFNRSVTESLLDGALAGLREHGVADQAIDVLRVPGAFEITVAAEHCAASGRYAALICLGAVVRGETPHFEFISREVSRGVNDVACRHRIPVAFGVLTTDTIEQAIERAGAKAGNKGWDAAITAIEMVDLFKKL